MHTVHITGTTQRRPQVRSPSSIFEQYDPRAEPRLKPQVNLSLLRSNSFVAQPLPFVAWGSNEIGWVSKLIVSFSAFLFVACRAYWWERRGGGEGAKFYDGEKAWSPIKSFNSRWLALPRSTVGSRVNSCAKKSKWKYARGEFKAE